MNHPESLQPQEVARPNHGPGAISGSHVGPSSIAPPSAAPEERRILTLMGEARRVGRWIVPRLLRVRALLGEVKIDLRGNAIPDDFTLDVRAVGARVTLIVPPGIDVRMDVFALLGNALNGANEPTSEHDALPSIRVRGSALLGEVRVLVREAGK